MDSKKYIVFLDLDGTICSINSGYALVKTAYSKKLTTTGGIARAAACLLLYKLHLVPAERIISIMGGWIKGMKQETLEAVGAEAAEKFLFDSVFSEVYAEIMYHRSRNAELAILSSAICEICRPLAIHLGIDNSVCTEMETRDGSLTGSPLGSYCFGKEKKRRVISICLEKGYNPAEAFYYADSLSDLDALESVGNPVCVNPDTRLRRKAVEKGWQVRTWKTVAFKNNPV
jgi:HAD superfamily hydrolase (TIGR01490 family)